MDGRDSLLSAHILAKRLGVPRAAVYDWLRSPHPIPAYRTGVRALRFRWGEVLAWLEARRLQPKPGAHQAADLLQEPQALRP